MKKIRFGVVGPGFWGGEVHIPGLKSRDDVEVVGVWGRDSAKTQATAARFGIRPFARFEDMLKAVDAVDFAVPPDVQDELAIAAAEAGKHLLLEKPVSRSVANAERLADAVRRRGVASTVFFTRRFVPELEAAIASLARGRWREARVRNQSGAMLAGSPFAGSVWRQAEGAALWDIGPHVLSLIVPVLGAVRSARASLEPERVVRLRFKHEGGAASDATVSLHANLPAPLFEYEFRDGERRALLPNPDFARPPALARAAGELIEAMRTGRAHRCDAAFGRDATLALAAAERSLESGADEKVR